VLLMLALDLGVFNRKAHVIGFKESLTWTAVWIALAMVFNGWVWHQLGPQKGLEFFTGYVIEKSLSVDNVFVFALLFSYFAVPQIYQHKVLFWGVLGALVMRAAMIVLGAALITKFSWIIYVFGAFLIITGLKMIFKKEEEIHPENNPVVRWFKKLMPVTKDFRGDKFFVRENGIRMAKFHYLKIGLGFVLSFVGVKMLFAHSPWKVDTLISLGVIVGILAVSVIASLLKPKPLVS
jgi:tellurite resistance protein TerC